MANTRMPAPKELLHTLSAKPPSTCRSELLNFDEVGLPEYKNRFAVLIHDLLSPEECSKLLEVAEESQGHKWEGAMINVGCGEQKLMTDIRLCGRIIWDTPEIVGRLLERIKPHLPPEVITLKNSAGITGWGPVRRKETMEMTRLNERLRFLKYTSGMYFREHYDGSYVTPDGKEISFLTVHIYLNNQVEKDVGGFGAANEDWISPGIDATGSKKTSEGSENLPLKGGATRFFGLNDNYYDVNPATGACLVFQHRGLCHSGEDVVQGTKYTVRTDIMYRKAEDA